MKTAPRFLVVLFVAFVSGLPAQTTPLRIEQTVEPQFPAVLSMSILTEGEARVIINVDADGRLVDWLVSAYTHKAFADEAVNALRRWHYTAAIEQGQPTGVRMELRFKFESTGRVISLTTMDIPEVLLKRMGIQPSWVTPVCNPQELDRPITPVNPVPPFNPGQASPAARPRSVVIDFYVDEEGRPRMPVVINAPHQILARAAMSALNQWRFIPPTRAGQPVAVRVRQEFIFPAGS